MNLARAIHFDESDQRVFHVSARTGEWCISGGFEFSNWTEGELVGKKRQAFANGWLGLDSFGRATFVAVAIIEPSEREDLIYGLANHFVAYYGAPDVEAASGVAAEEIAFMADLCEDHPPNTLLAMSRELTDSGVKEQFRHIAPQDAELDLVAVHGSIDDVKN